MVVNEWRLKSPIRMFHRYSYHQSHRTIQCFRLLMPKETKKNSNKITKRLSEQQTFTFSAVQRIDAARQKLFKQRHMLNLLEEHMALQLNDRWPFDRMPLHAHFRKIVKLIGKLSHPIDLSRFGNAITDARISAGRRRTRRTI